MADPTGLEILVRAVAGEAYEQPTEGVVAVRLDEDHADLTRFRVWKHADRWRVGDEDGRPRCIQDARFTYDFALTRTSRTGRNALGAVSDDPVADFLRRPEPADWRPDDDDDSRLASPPRRMVHLRHPVDAPVDEEDDDLGDRAERTVWSDDRWRWTLVTYAVDVRSRPALVE